jgi:hypothetical protein
VFSWVAVGFSVINLIGLTRNILVTYALWGLAIWIRWWPGLRERFSGKSGPRRELEFAEQRWEHARQLWRTECSTGPFELAFAHLMIAKDELTALSADPGTDERRARLMAQLREGPADLYRKLADLASKQAQVQKVVDSYWQELEKARHRALVHQK